MIVAPQKNELTRVHELETDYAGSHESFTEFNARFDRWSNLFVVYKQNDEIIGQISPKITDTHVQIYSVAVEYAYWGSGIGRALISRFEQLGRKHGLPFQVASGLNTSGFYQKLGYRPEMYLWYTQATDVADILESTFILDIQEREHGFRSVYIQPELPDDVFANLKSVAQDDLSLLHEKPLA